MSLARHGDGPAAVFDAFRSQIHPVFMLPPVAASAFGAVLAVDFTVPLAALHMATAFCALYVAHLKDGYVDFHIRDEDDDHPLSARGCRVGLAGASVAFFAGCLALGVLVDPIAALLTLPGWLIGYLHAPQLDLHPVGATAGYPTGIGIALLGGFYVQTTTLTLPVVAYAVVFTTILCGIKTVDDATDYAYDTSIDKRTVAVVLGRQRARRLAHWLMIVGMAAVVLLAALGVFPPTAVLAPVVFGAVFVVSRAADEKHATMLLIRGSYLFLAVLVVAAWFQPLR
ncbi:UbiA family prenyltransferase [Halohasta litorea]|uniref:UbiA family prenyltransferase n=1 Tax=Halohasta litorea TaxID=869891 RepID=A0ABD6D4W5_9EURY|nr:UbiA family prenyltransferase [Halohasta litorea]